MERQPVQILTPVGMFGYGYEVDKLYQGIKMGATAIIRDSGSTDSGPNKLALGETTCPRSAYVRDFSHVLNACYHHKVKVIITSAGGDGSNQHVDEFGEIVNEYCHQEGYSLKVAKIYAGIPKAVVRKALKDGVISPCTSSVPELTVEDVESAIDIVAQMGQEPLLKVMEEHPDYDVIIAGRCYDPAGYAAYAVNNGIDNLGIAYHMGKVMECGGQCAWPKAKEAFVTVWNDKFEVLPLQPGSVCSPQSLAAHSLYENSATDLHSGPKGMLNLTNARFDQSGPRSASSSGATFEQSCPYTIKLEGARILGYRSVWMGSFRDPVLIAQIDDFMLRMETHLEVKFGQGQFQVSTKLYGKNGTMGSREPDRSVGKEIFLVGEIQADNQTLATQIANSARVFCVHAPYPNQISTTGNFAMPFTPLEIPTGPITCFNIYHLLPVEDPTTLFPSRIVQAGPANNQVERDSSFGFALIGPEEIMTGIHQDVDIVNGQKNTAPARKRGQTPLTSLARDIRSKNAGPFEITFDVIFNDFECFEYARQSPLLTASALAPLWQAEEKDVIFCEFFEPARAFKISLPRFFQAGALGERDIHCSQQHIPLLNLVI